MISVGNQDTARLIVQENVAKYENTADHCQEKFMLFMVKQATEITNYCLVSENIKKQQTNFLSTNVFTQHSAYNDGTHTDPQTHVTKHTTHNTTAHTHIHAYLIILLLKLIKKDVSVLM